jgi:Tfp pilus assembly protein PilP
MKRHIMAAAILSLAFLCAAGTTGCTPETDVPVRRVSSTNEIKAKRTTFDRSALETTDDNWKPVQASEQIIQQRNPFHGFTDTLLAEALLREKAKEEEHNDVQLPEQLYGTRDYRVMGVITGTADPKVYVVDPGGNRFILRRGSMIGNNNGSISSIRRDGIEIYERVGDKGQYIELPLYEENKDRKKIQLSLQQ